VKIAFIFVTALTIALLALVAWAARLSLFAAAIATFFFGYVPEGKLIAAAILLAASGVLAPAPVANIRQQVVAKP
jgi:hypothetical protein